MAAPDAGLLASPCPWAAAESRARRVRSRPVLGHGYHGAGVRGTRDSLPRGRYQPVPRLAGKPQADRVRRRYAQGGQGGSRRRRRESEPLGWRLDAGHSPDREVVGQTDAGNVGGPLRGHPKAGPRTVDRGDGPAQRGALPGDDRDRERLIRPPIHVVQETPHERRGRAAWRDSRAVRSARDGPVPLRRGRSGEQPDGRSAAGGRTRVARRLA